MKTVEAVQLFMTNCELKGLSAKTIKQYRQQLSYLSKAFKKLPTKPEQIETILSSINATRETIHSYYRTYRAAYNFWDKRYKTGNPMLNVTPPKLKSKVMPTLEASDLNLLYIFSTKGRDKALISLLLDTGIRASEATNLKRDGIKEGYIIVDGKVGQRTVPISDFVTSMLLSLPQREDGYVFHGHSGKLTRSGAYRIVNRTLQRIGITGPKLGPHRLRHTAGRQYLVLGGDVRSLQMILGHKNIKTTEKYTSLTLEDIKQKHKKYSPAQLMEVQNEGVNSAAR